MADEDTPPGNTSDNAPKLTAVQIKERGVSGDSVKQALMGTGQMDYVLDAQGNLRMPKNSSTDNSKTNAVEKTEALIAEFREVFESLKDVGLVLEHAGKSSANIRKKLEEAIKASQTQLARVEALKDLGNTYEAKADDVLDIAKAVEDGTKSKLAMMGRNTDGILKDFDDAGPRAALLKAGIRSVTRDRLNGGQQHPLLALKPPVWRNAVVARQLQHRFPARLVRESSARCPTVETMFANTLEAQPADIAEGLGGVAGLHLARHVLGLVPGKDLGWGSSPRTTRS